MSGGLPIDGPIHLGRYELLEQIAEGRTSDVFLAHSHGVEGFRRTVIIKRLKLELSRDADFVGRFLEQARRLFTLSHANIVQVLDLDQVDGQYYLVEEYIEGYDLAAVRVMAKAGGLTLSAPLGLFIAAEVAKGLEYGHRRLNPSSLEPLGLAHGDLHPCNILVGFEGQVKLADFGLGVELNAQDLSHDAGVLRAYSYAAPEVAAGEPAGQKSDIFSLGLMLAETCRGYHPFRSRTADKVRDKALRGRVSDKFLSAVPEPLREFVATALRFDPQERVVDLGALYDRLILYLHQAHEYTDAKALAEFTHKIIDIDLRTAVVDSGIITTEHTQRQQVVTSPTLGYERPDRSELWEDPGPLSLPRPEPSARLPLPEPEDVPLGINGREAELVILREEAQRVRGDACHVLFVSGPRGIGKSHLLRHGFDALRADGYRGVLLSPDLDTAARPYGASLSLLALATLGRPLLWTEVADQALADALEEQQLGDAESRALAAQLVRLTDYDPRQRPVVRNALGRLFEDMVGQPHDNRPFVLFLDAPESSDLLSLELLHATLLANRPGPLLLVIASLNKALLNQLSRAATASRRTTMVLPALGAEPIARLVKRVAGDDPSTEALRAASGSPHWAVEVGLALRLGQFQGQRPDRLVHFVPHLGETLSAVLAACSIAGIPLPLGDLAELLERPIDSIRRATHQGAALQLLYGDPYGGWSLAPRGLQSDAEQILGDPRSRRFRTDLSYRVAKLHRGNNALNGPLRVRLKLDSDARASGLDLGRQHANLLIDKGFTNIAMGFLDRLAGLAASQSVGSPRAALDLRLEQVQLSLSAMRLERGREILAQLPTRALDAHDEAGMLCAAAQGVRLALRRDEVRQAELALRGLTSSVDSVAEPRVLALTRLALTEYYERRGQLRPATDHAQRALDILEQSAVDGLLREDVRFTLVGLLVRLGEPHRAAQLLDRRESNRAAELTERRFAGLSALADGDFAAAIVALDTAFRIARRTDRAAAALALAPELVEALARGGRNEDAETRLAELEELTERLNAPRARKRLRWLRLFLDSGGTAALQAELVEARLDDPAGALEIAWLLWLRAPGPEIADAVVSLALLVGDRSREAQLRR